MAFGTEPRTLYIQGNPTTEVYPQPFPHLKIFLRFREMARQVRAFAIKADNLNLISGTYVDEGENELP